VRHSPCRDATRHGIKVIVPELRGLLCASAQQCACHSSWVVDGPTERGQAVMRGCARAPLLVLTVVSNCILT
jgi:hypothetical protein